MTRCTYCEAGNIVTRVPVPKHVERVGSMEVTDGTAVVSQCDSCGRYDLTVSQLAGYERRAAALALREGPQSKITGDVVRYARKALGLRQTDLALVLEVSAETVSRWETATESPAISRAVQLAIIALLDGVQSQAVNLQDVLAKAKAHTSSESTQLEVRVGGSLKRASGC